MLTIALCDDEAQAARALAGQVSRFLQLRVLSGRVEVFSSGERLLADRSSFDIVLMDVRMAGMDGMAAVRALRDRGGDSAVIFVTACRDAVFQSFDVDAVHYLVKPVEDEALFRALDKAVARTAAADCAAITLQRGHAVQVVPMRCILYCEALDHKLSVVTAQGAVECYATLDEVCRQLDGRFFRCHRSYVVNLAHVCAKEADCAVLTGGGRVPVSRRNRGAFAQHLLAYLQKEVI